MHVAVVCLDMGDMVNSDITHFFLNIMVPLSLWFITIPKLLQMIYKCGLKTHEMHFSMSHRGKDKASKGMSGTWRKIMFVKVTGWKQRLFKSLYCIMY